MVRKSLFSKKLPHCLPTWLHRFAFPPAVMRAPGSPCTHPRLMASAFWVWAVLLGMQCYQNAALVRTSLVTYDVVSLFSCLFAIGKSLGEVFVQVFCPLQTLAPRGINPLRPHHWGPGSLSGAHAGSSSPLLETTWDRDWTDSAAHLRVLTGVVSSGHMGLGWGTEHLLQLDWAWVFRRHCLWSGGTGVWPSLF